MLSIKEVQEKIFKSANEQFNRAICGNYNFISFSLETHIETEEHVSRTIEINGFTYSYSVDELGNLTSKSNIEELPLDIFKKFYRVINDLDGRFGLSKGRVPDHFLIDYYDNIKSKDPDHFQEVETHLKRYKLLENDYQNSRNSILTVEYYR